MSDQPAAPAADYAFGATGSAMWARRTACDAEISRVVIGPRSEPIDLGRAARTFTAAQTRALIVRDRHCIWAGCDMPPGWCEGHHVQHWADGGNTDLDNAVLLCGRHHDKVHLYGHAIDINPDTGQRTINPIPGSDPNWKGPRHRAGP